MKKGPVTQLKEDFDRTKAESKTHYDNYLRALADFENFRKRKEREIEEFRTFANESLIAEIIPVLDNFDRALAIKDIHENCVGLKKGIEIAYRQLTSILEKFGLKEFSCLGQEFDPKTCEAISFFETNEQEKNTIVEELNKGYLYQSRVIRPARVIVAKPLSQDKENQDKENQEEKSDAGEQQKECDSA